MDFVISIVVECPVEEAFRACDSVADQVRWIGSLEEVQVEAGGSWGVGSRFTQIHQEAGMRQEIEGEILAYEPCSLIHMRLLHPQFDMKSELKFENLGVRCRITQRTEVELRSMMLKMMKGAIKGTVEQRIQDDFERLRVLVENRG